MWFNFFNFYELKSPYQFMKNLVKNDYINILQQWLDILLGYKKKILGKIGNNKNFKKLIEKLRDLSGTSSHWSTLAYHWNILSLTWTPWEAKTIHAQARGKKKDNFILKFILQTSKTKNIKHYFLWIFCWPTI